jgi:hypothetical protein
MKFCSISLCLWRIWKEEIFLFFLATLKLKCNIEISTWSSIGNQNQIYKCWTNMKLGTTMNMGVKERKRITFENCVLNPLIIMVWQLYKVVQKINICHFIIEFNQIIKKFNSSWFELRPNLIKIGLNWIEFILYFNSTKFNSIQISMRVLTLLNVEKKNIVFNPI